MKHRWRFSNVSVKQLEEELASQDLPLVLNSTPGVYATSQGGGDGDARITIRGFNQRNVAVMIDGVPVNDMENGWVYWSNWFGLDAITKTIQVQRGLGASKLAIPSVGGTLNILTKGIDSKPGFTVKQELGTGWYSRTTVGGTTGRMDNGFGITAAMSFKRGNGWVDEAYTRGFFYYLKVEKNFGNHRIGLTGYGAPQHHGQRSFKAPAGDFDRDYAENTLGIDSNDVKGEDYGIDYNQHWGYLQREGESESKAFNERKNYYHKPQLSLRHSWAANDRFFLSSALYASIGRGGGTGRAGVAFQTVDSTGQQNIQLSYDANQNRASGEAKTILRSSVNNHFWLGALSTFGYQVSDNVDVSGGIDLRTYKGEHYREVYDLLGGDYFVNTDADNRDFGRDRNTQLGEGDKFYYHDDGLVRWAGAFGMVEYKKRVGQFLL